ncbi:MAG: YitT family protein, partial [Bacillota bacterium]|nr:YitT family protein [Bacillota bacterium]
GCIIAAAGLVFFLVPNKIAAGGVSGLATVIFHVTGLPVGMTMLAFNIPLFIFGVKKLGVGFGIKSLFGTILLSVSIDLMELWTSPLTEDPLLASLYGGIVVGIGLAIVFRFKGTTGGTTLAAQLFHARFKQISIGQSLLIIDFIVILLAGIAFNIELALYALIAIFVTAKAIDVIQEGVGYAKACFIISDKAPQIADAIISQIDRGGTMLDGYGIYTGKDRQILISVISRNELSELKRIVYCIDPKAFVIVTDANEALGEGFNNLESR